MASDQHRVGRRHVQPVVIESGDPRFARGHRAGHHGRPAAGLAGQGQQRGEGPGVGRLVLDHGDAAGLGQGAGVDQVDPLRGDRFEQAAQHGRDQRGAVVLGQFAGDLERQGADAAA